ncbi:Acyl CoA binding protein [compost metagenome]|jgi:acyl-CoA-binding protein
MTIDPKIEADFQQAKGKLRLLKTRPTEQERAQLWKHYKQALYGDYDPQKDYGFNATEYLDGDADIKKDGWGDLKGLSQESAKRKYVELSAPILKKYS